MIFVEKNRKGFFIYQDGKKKKVKISAQSLVMKAESCLGFIGNAIMNGKVGPVFSVEKFISEISRKIHGELGYNGIRIIKINGKSVNYKFVKFE